MACVNDLIRRAVTLPLDAGRFAYVAPYLSQAKEVAWEYLKRFAQPITTDKNEAELWVELVNGSRIRIHGADNPDRLRGAYLDGVVLDEYADMRPSVWGEVIRPMLADRQGWATFIGTPKGRNEFHAIYEAAGQSPEWYRMLMRASETGLLPAGELEAARADMTPEQYAQEFECSFDAAIRGAYYASDIAQAEHDGRITVVDPDPNLPIYTAWDLGISDSMAIWVWQPSFDGLRVIDFIEDNGKGLKYYCDLLASRYAVKADFVPHDAKVRELGTGRTRIETLASLGRNTLLVADHKVMDGINALRVSMPKIWFDRDRCAWGIEMLRRYREKIDEKTQAFTGKPEHGKESHAADAARYMAMAWRQLVPKPKPQLPKNELIFEADEFGRLRGNLSVREIVALKEKRRKNASY